MPPTRSDSRASTPIEPSQARYQKTLQVLQNIRDLCGGQLSLPQICVVGDQSSGKSALLEVLTNIKFPVKSGICTKAPIIVECKNDPGTATTQFFIQDRSTLTYRAVALDTLDEEITRIQNEDLGKLASASDDSTPAPKISHEEIRLQAVGSTQIDIVVVDLPGLINTGTGKDDTRTLIRKYIKHDQTLILLVSEAKQDWELTSAIELADEFDQEHKRTVRVLTKFDTFDSSDARTTASKLIMDEATSKLGAHAVICRPSGKDEYSHEKELQFLHQLDESLPPERGGVKALKERLPLLFEELIQANLPGLKAEIDTKLLQAKRQLQRFGEHAVDPITMISECQRVLIKNFATLEQKLTPGMEIFKEAIHETGERITEEWCAEKLVPNAFKCPFFQGEPAFLDCLEEIADWWKPLLHEYVAHVDQELKVSLGCIDTDAIGVSKTLLGALKVKWSEVCPVMFSEFVDACESALHEEKDFGTINHYLQDKYAEDMILPDELLQSFIASLHPSHFLSPHASGQSLSYDSDGKMSISDARGCTHAVEWRTQLKNLLENARRVWGEEFGKKSLHEQLQRRLFAAVKAAWAVEKKTFTDMVLKKTRDHLLKVRQMWVRTQLLTDTGLRASAVEDASQEARRTETKRDIEKLCRCQEEINTIVVSLA